MNRRESKRNSPAVFSRLSQRRGRRGLRLKARRPAWPNDKKPLSLLEIGVDRLGERLDRNVTLEPLAVDEKGRCGIDQKLLGGAVAHCLDVIQHLLIRQALVERLF